MGPVIAGGSRGSRYSSSLMAARYSASSSTSSSSKSISMCWRLPRAALSWSTRASRLRISSSLASTAEARVIEAKIDVAAGAGATVSVSHCASWSTASTSPEGRASIATDHVASRAADNGANSSITLRRSQAVASGEGCQECKGKHAFV